MKPFVTGSRAYGTPREDSDLDIVLPVSVEDYVKIFTLANPTTPIDEYAPVRFGNLNFILINIDQEKGRTEYESFVQAYQELMPMKPVTREYAKEVHLKWRKALEARDLDKKLIDMDQI